MLQRVLIVVVVVPLALILLALAVANRAMTPLTVDPFNPGNPGLTIELPLFVHLLLALILGVIIGSIATWFRQGRFRRIARERTQEAEQLRRERETQSSELVRTDS